MVNIVINVGIHVEFLGRNVLDMDNIIAKVLHYIKDFHTLSTW